MFKKITFVFLFFIFWALCIGADGQVKWFKRNKQPIAQPIARPISQPITQPINQPIGQQMALVPMSTSVRSIPSASSSSSNPTEIVMKRPFLSRVLNFRLRNQSMRKLPSFVKNNLDHVKNTAIVVGGAGGAIEIIRLFKSENETTAETTTEAALLKSEISTTAMTTIAAEVQTKKILTTTSTTRKPTSTPTHKLGTMNKIPTVATNATPTKFRWPRKWTTKRWTTPKPTGMNFDYKTKKGPLTESLPKSSSSVDIDSKTNPNELKISSQGKSDGIKMDSLKDTLHELETSTASTSTTVTTSEATTTESTTTQATTTEATTTKATTTTVNPSNKIIRKYTYIFIWVNFFVDLCMYVFNII